MVEVIFRYDGIDITIQGNSNDKMEDFVVKFANKISKNEQELIFCYGGNLLDLELTFEKIANSYDKKRNKMNVVAYKEKTTVIKNTKDKEIAAKESICPICMENILIKLKDYKISYECKNNHKETVLMNKYEDTQKIDLSKMLCNKCQNSRNKIYNYVFYFCSTCEINLCPLCSQIHDKSHNIVFYDFKNYFCSKHKESFIKFCKTCQKNLCLLCTDEHKNHEIVNFENIFVKKDEYSKDLNDFGIIISKLKEHFDEIKEIFNNIISNIDKYYKINQNIFDNYEYNKRNYHVLNNLNEFKNNNKIIIKDINNIINEENYLNKFNYIIDMYNKFNDKRINNESEIDENGDKYVGEFKKGLRNGKGVLYYNEKDVYKRIKYVGEFRNGMREGKGILYWKDGSRYEGDFKKDEKDGKGFLYYISGNKYEGEFKNGIRNGKGIFYFINGDKYEGEYKNDQKNGNGIFYFNNSGNRYEGPMLKDKFNGKGIYYYNHPKNKRYEGEYKNSRRDGKGILYFNNGDRYDGDWKNDAENGKGIFYYNNGDMEIGDYKNGQKVGKHVFLDKDGNISIKEYNQ